MSFDFFSSLELVSGAIVHWCFLETNIDHWIELEFWVYCSKARNFTLTVPLSSYEYYWLLSLAKILGVLPLVYYHSIVSYLYHRQKTNEASNFEESLHLTTKACSSLKRSSTVVYMIQITVDNKISPSWVEALAGMATAWPPFMTLSDPFIWSFENYR